LSRSPFDDDDEFFAQVQAGLEHEEQGWRQQVASLRDADDSFVGKLIEETVAGDESDLLVQMDMLGEPKRLRRRSLGGDGSGRSADGWTLLLMVVYNVVALGDGVKNSVAIAEEGFTVSGAIDLAADVSTIGAEFHQAVLFVRAARHAQVANGFAMYLYMLSLGNKYLFLLTAFISAIEAANGFGPPVTGRAFTDSASQFDQVHTTLQSAAADPMKWSGSAADKYRIKNSEQQAFAETVANANRKLADLLQNQAKQVDVARTALASIKLALGPAALTYSYMCQPLLVTMADWRWEYKPRTNSEDIPELGVAPDGLLELDEYNALVRRCTLYLRRVGLTALIGALGVVTASATLGLLTRKSAEAEEEVLNEVARNASDARNAPHRSGGTK